MTAGFRGTFVISWAQTELDGQTCAPLSVLRVGMEWSWTGPVVRVDGPTDILPLGAAIGEGALHQRAATAIARHRGRPSTPPQIPGVDRSETSVLADGFTVTDGHDTWTVGLVWLGPDKPPLAMFAGGLPPRDRVLWVVHHTPDRATPQPVPKGVICFTVGTLILTETGPRPVELLVEGDRVQTKDSGCQAVLWIGRRRLTGARLYAMPHLRPVRINTGALDQNVPDAGLVVSPDHRIVLRGPRACALFNCDEVLVRARDLINDRTVLFDNALREVTYFHLLLPSHQIVFANGVETESFHPAGAALDPGQWAALDARIPDLAADPYAYGTHARRALTQSEAAILRAT